MPEVSDGCQREEGRELLDVFKRLSAARALPGVASLEARILDVDEPTAKVTILGLNGTGRRMKELEEAWIVHALVREDGLSQVEVAELLGRHKSWSVAVWICWSDWPRNAGKICVWVWRRRRWRGS